MARLNIYNGNILISNDSPVSGQEFTVTVPLNNQETFPPGINSDAACNLDGSVTAGHGGILTLTISHEDQGEVKQQQEKVCLNQANLGPEERISFDCTVNEPGEVTITAEIDPSGNDPPDSKSVSITVLEQGGGGDPTTPGNGGGGGGGNGGGGGGGVDLPFGPGSGTGPGGGGGGLLAFALDNPGAALALSGGAAIAISTFTSSLTE